MPTKEVFSGNGLAPVVLVHTGWKYDEGDKYLGLARFFRAYFYWLKVRDFGDVPWYDTELSYDSEQLYKARDSRETVMRHMIDDVDFAIANLPSEPDPYRVWRLKCPGPS